MHRVEKLASREIKSGDLKIDHDRLGVRWIGYGGRPSYVMLVPLTEILAESLETIISSQKVMNEYKKLTSVFGGEFGVLLKAPVSEILKISGSRVAEGIKKVRSGEIAVEPGYDGVFGVVRIWPKESASDMGANGKKQLTLF